MGYRNSDGRTVTRNLALDLKPIRVNCVSPGAIETELWEGMPKEVKDGMMEAIVAKVPTGRIGQRKYSLTYLLQERKNFDH